MFKKITHLFKIDRARQEEVYDDIKEEARGDFDFYLLAIFAGIIITLGLLIDSGAVIIGGMLIAPLFWPVLSLAMAIVKGRVILLKNSLLAIAKAVVVILFFAILIGLLSPFDLGGEEFLSRTQPTLVELLIALAAGFIGAFIVAYPKIHSSIAGVVMAVALVPPICVLGLTIVEGNLEQMGGALLLFVTNLLAITLSAALYFMLAHFTVHGNGEERRRRRVDLLWTVFFLVLAVIPLFFITRNIIKQDKDEEMIKVVVEEVYPEARIDSLQLTDKDDKLYIDLSLNLTENLTAEETAALTKKMSQRLDRSVELEVIVILTMKAGEELSATSSSGKKVGDGVDSGALPVKNK